MAMNRVQMKEEMNRLYRNILYPCKIEAMQALSQRRVAFEIRINTLDGKPDCLIFSDELFTEFNECTKSDDQNDQAVKTIKLRTSAGKRHKRYGSRLKLERAVEDTLVNNGFIPYRWI